jgi:acyl-coenzyme A thioesterase PaaI-like protein
MTRRPDDPEAFVAAFIRSVPLASHLGFEADADPADGRLSIRQPRVAQSLAWPGGPISHGALTALLDQIFAASILREAPEMLITTIGLHIDWLDDWGSDDEITATVDPSVRVGDAAHAQAILRTAPDRVVARASAVFLLGAAPGGRPGLRDWTAVNLPPVAWPDFEAFLGAGVDHPDVLPPAAHLVGMRSLPAFHGGVIAAAMGRSADRLAQEDGGPFRLASSAVRYLRPGLATEFLEIEAGFERRGRRVASVRASAFQVQGAEGRRAIAHAEFVYVGAGAPD